MCAVLFEYLSGSQVLNGGNLEGAQRQLEFKRGIETRHTLPDEFGAQFHGRKAVLASTVADADADAAAAAAVGSTAATTSRLRSNARR